MKKESIHIGIQSIFFSLFLFLLVSLGMTQPVFADEKVIGNTNCTNSIAANGWGGICQTKLTPWSNGCTGGRQYVGLCDSGASDGCCIPGGSPIPASPPAKIETTLLSMTSCQASHGGTGQCKVRVTPASDGCDNATEDSIGLCQHWYSANADGCCVPKVVTPPAPAHPACTGTGETCRSTCRAEETSTAVCTSGLKCCVAAGTAGTSTLISFSNPLAFGTVEGVLGSLLGALQGIIVVLSLVFIVIGAVLYILSVGDDGRMKTAKGAITASMIGLAIGIAAPSFLKQIGDILGWGAVDNSLLANTKTLTGIALSTLQFLLSIVGILGIIMLVIGGLAYITAGGDEDRSKTGKKIVTYAIIGIAVALASLIIVTQIAKLFV